MESLRFEKHPHAVYLIHTEDCKGARPWVGEKPIYFRQDIKVGSH